ncbi:hypothetical protein EON77_08095, partial [bacterium]
MRRLASLSLLLVTGASFAQTGTTYTERESNNTRATANSFNLRGDPFYPNTNDQLIGVAAGDDVDRYNLSGYTTNALADVSLYTDRVGTQGIYGRSLTAAGTRDTTSDVLVQPATVSGSGMYNRFASLGSFSVDAGISNTGSNLYTTRLSYSYGFGSSGGATLGTFQGSTITITAGSQTIDSDIVLVGRRSGSEPYRFLGANNDAGPDTRGSRIVANDLSAAPDEYIVYLSDSNLATSILPDANEFARDPSDPRTSLLDPSSLIVPTSSATISIPITISDAYGRSVTTTYNKTGYGMAAFFFRVAPAPPVPEPAT